jgi:hypothetical protein
MGVTVCIAAICKWDENTEAIVTACDQMLSLGQFSADNITTKIDPIHPAWEAMFAGDDITRVDYVLEAVREILCQPPIKPRSFVEVSRAFSTAHRKVRRHVVESTVLAPYSMTLKQFLRDGMAQFGAENFTALLQVVQGTTLGCTFLVCGFGQDGEPHIFTVSESGESQIYDRPGCWAIGSGQQSALSSLFFHSYNRLHDYKSAIYHVCEAKFMAETAIGVGKKTFLSMYRLHYPRLYTTESSIEEIRKAWETDGKPRVPHWIKDRIPQMLIDATKLDVKI